MLLEEAKEIGLVGKAGTQRHFLHRQIGGGKQVAGALELLLIEPLNRAEPILSLKM